MTRRVRRVSTVVLALFAALFVNLNVVQVLRADEYADNPRNATRQLQREYKIRRGSILAADAATEIARVEETGGSLRFRRVYSDGPLYAHVTGFYSFVFGRAELERSENDVLTGRADVIGSFGDLLSGREQRGDTVVSTVRAEVQRAAREALGDRRGSVVALDPATGDVLAMWSSPSYDPNELSQQDGAAVRSAWDRLNADPDRPLENRATRRFYAPGSTFKLVTTAAALAAGKRPEDTFPDPVRQDLPQTTATIGNFGGGLCNDGAPITLAKALQVSCNTTFAQLALELGPERLVQQAEAFGINADLGGQLPSLVPSQIPAAATLDPPATAQSAIGQRDVQVTPVQMASVAAAIGEGGVLNAPRLVREIEDFGGATLETRPTSSVGQAVSPEIAAVMREMMVSVVERGTGRAARISGVRVAGKTGTAESGVEGMPPTVWFVGFAPADDPVIAVAVVVEDGGEVGNEATGGAVAAPIARAVLEAGLTG